MKKRSGFVSNSSSSSFIVAFPCLAHTLPLRSLRELLFEGAETWDDYSTEEVAETVLRDLVEQGRPATKEEVLKVLDSGYVIGCPEFKQKGQGESWDEYDERRRVWDNDFFDTFIPPHKNVYFFTYEDSGSYFSMMEHSDVFHNLPNVRVSHH